MEAVYEDKELPVDEGTLERLEDEQDLAEAGDAYAEYIRSGRKSRPISELWDELDL